MLTEEEEARKAQLLHEIKELESGARDRYLNQARDRVYRFADIPKPPDLAKLKRFQKIFGRYIPELLTDENATIRLHSRLSNSIHLNPPETIRKTDFEGDIKRFRKAITTLAEFEVWGTKPCISNVPRLSEVGNDEDVLYAAGQIYHVLVLIDDLKNYHGTLSRVLDELERWAREASKYIPDRRNINWEAVHAVDNLHLFWESWTETPAPRRALNPASPFADYLRDAFEFFGISGDPVAAFKRWAALEVTEPDTWK